MFLFALRAYKRPTKPTVLTPATPVNRTQDVSGLHGLAPPLSLRRWGQYAAVAHMPLTLTLRLGVALACGAADRRHPAVWLLVAATTLCAAQLLLCVLCAPFNDRRLASVETTVAAVTTALAVATLVSALGRGEGALDADTTAGVVLVVMTVGALGLHALYCGWWLMGPFRRRHHKELRECHRMVQRCVLLLVGRRLVLG